MSWDPITRIVGSLGITRIDFSNQSVLQKCYSTSMIFRGFDIFMKGIDPRDALHHQPHLRSAAKHCTCSCLNQNMAYGVKPPPSRVQHGRVCGLRVRPRDLQRLHGERGLLRADGQGTNPSLLAKAENTRRRTRTPTATRRSPTSCGR
jgi:hydrogenase large subunit